MGSARRARLEGAARLALAVVLALTAAEIALRAMNRPHKHDFRGSCDNEMGQPDDRLGWVWRGPYARTVEQGHRPVPFAFDAHHDRVRDATFAEDAARPTLLLVGESIAAGHGLTWDESLPGRLEAATGLQVVDLGVDGYGPDQAFVRLVDALPRLPRVVAVVTVFFPALLDRLAWDDRPRLTLDGGEVRLGPPSIGPFHDLRVVRLVDDLRDRRSPEVLDLAAAILAQTAARARAVGARPLFLTPTLAFAARPGDAAQLARVLDAQGLERTGGEVPIATLPGDHHPDAPSTHRLAASVVAALGRPGSREEKDSRGPK